MKNKKVKLGILVLAAATLFTATAFATASGNDGYETLKQIMKDSKEIKHFSNASFKGTFQMSDNGKVIAEMTGEGKGNLEGKEASGNVQVKLMGKEQDLSFYKSAEASYLVDETNSKYYQLVNMTQETSRRHEAYRRDHFTGGHKMGAAGEALLDYFVGDLKSQFAVSKNADGTRSITLDLNQDEIPAALNLLAGVAVEKNSGDYNSDYNSHMDPAQKELLMQKLPFLKEFSDLGKETPKLTQNVKFTGIVLIFNVDEKNQIKSFDAKVNITGEDANGAYHEISFQGSVSVSDINNTVVDTFNPDGKSIETIDCEAFKCDRE